MIQLPSLREMDLRPQMPIYLCLTPTDMRCGFDKLAQLVREGLGCDPFSGALFLFTARRKDRLKILYWDRDGFAIWYKRLEIGTFRLPTAGVTANGHVELKASELAMLLEGIDLRSVRRLPRYARPGASTGPDNS